MNTHPRKWGQQQWEGKLDVTAVLKAVNYLNSLENTQRAK